VDYDAEVLNDIQNHNSAKVIVLLEQQSQGSIGSQSINDVNQLQQQVLDTLNLNSDTGSLGTASLDYDLNLEHQYNTVPAFAGTLTQSGFDKLVNNQLVKKIEYDRIGHGTLDNSAPLIKADVVNSQFVQGQYLDGSGETVCIIDTGIDYTHPAFGGCNSFSSCSKIRGGYDFVNNDNDPMDDNGHGTHIAGIVSSDDLTYKGIAPGAQLTIVKVLGSSNSFFTSDLIAGIDYCSVNAALEDISVISLSLATSSSYESHLQCTSNEAALYTAVSTAISQDITVVAASGNSGQNNGIPAPACFDEVIAVGSTFDNGVNEQFASYSNINLNDGKPEVLAPGGDSTQGNYITSTSMGGGFSQMSGTSMATPHVAGVVAIMNEYNTITNGNDLLPTDVMTKLINSGDSITVSSSSISRINAENALSPTMTFGLNMPPDGATLFRDSILFEASSDWDLSSGGKMVVRLTNIGDNSFVDHELSLKVGGKLAKLWVTGLQNHPQTTYTYQIFGVDGNNLQGETDIRSITLRVPVTLSAAPLTPTGSTIGDIDDINLDGIDSQNFGLTIAGEPHGPLVDVLPGPAFIEFKDGNDKVFEINHDFGMDGNFDVSNLGFDKGNGYVIIKNFDSTGSTALHTLYLEDASYTTVCAANKELTDISEMSIGCDGVSETFFTRAECVSGLTRDGLTCDLSSGFFSVSGLQHSGLGGGTCGNGIVEGNETCDDGNLVSGDGCSSICQIEGGAVPEFSDYAIALLLLTVVGGFVAMRRNNNF